jgi:hypothetical protein
MLADKTCIRNKVLARNTLGSKGGHCGPGNVQIASARSLGPYQCLAKLHTSTNAVVQLAVHRFEQCRGIPKQEQMVSVIDKHDTRPQPVNLYVPT